MESQELQTVKRPDSLMVMCILFASIGLLGLGKGLLDLVQAVGADAALEVSQGFLQTQEQMFDLGSSPMMDGISSTQQEILQLSKDLSQISFSGHLIIAFGLFFASFAAWKAAPRATALWKTMMILAGVFTVTKFYLSYQAQQQAIAALTSVKDPFGSGGMSLNDLLSGPMAQMQSLALVLGGGWVLVQLLFYGFSWKFIDFPDVQAYLRPEANYGLADATEQEDQISS